MLINTLNAISPVDGRYRSKTKPLHAFFSEQALIKYRVQVEIEYFIALCSHPIPQLESFQHSLFEDLRSIYEQFSPEDAKAIKDIEKTTNHDVKAVEYFLKNEFDRLGISDYKEFLHFGFKSNISSSRLLFKSITDDFQLENFNLLDLTPFKNRLSIEKKLVSGVMESTLNLKMFPNFKIFKIISIRSFNLISFIRIGPLFILKRVIKLKYFFFKI